MNLDWYFSVVIFFMVLSGIYIVSSLLYFGGCYFMSIVNNTKEIRVHDWVHRVLVKTGNTYTSGLIKWDELIGLNVIMIGLIGVLLSAAWPIPLAIALFYGSAYGLRYLKGN